MTPSPSPTDLSDVATLIARQRQALAFYATPENWREGCGTGPNRPAPCVADGGARAREVLERGEARQVSGELQP